MANNYITSINIDRIKWCCNEYGITLEQLAKEHKLNVDRMQTHGMTYIKLKSVADYFGRGVLFFLEDHPVVAEDVDTPQFRTLVNEKPSISPKMRVMIKRVEEQRDMYIALSEDIDEEDRIEFKHPKLPNDVIKAATIVRQWLGLNEKNDFDSYRKAVEDKGVLVFLSAMFKGKWRLEDDENVLAFSLYHEQCPVIFIKRQKSEARQTFSLMHELGHLLLHKNSSIDDNEDMYSYAGKEKVANLFAGHLLVPNGYLDRINVQDMPRNIEEYSNWLKTYKNKWGVSTEVILRRLMDAGKLSQERYEAYKTNYKNFDNQPPNKGNDDFYRAYRYREPIWMFGDRYVRTVLNFLESKEITLVKASQILDNLKLESLKKLREHASS